MKCWTEKLKRMNACSDAVEWAKDYDSLESAWAACERADWMLWLLSRNITQNSPEHRRLVACVCECGRTSLPYAGKWKEKLAAVYDTLEAWTRGEGVDLAAAWESADAAARASASDAARASASDAALASASDAAWASAAADAAARASASDAAWASADAAARASASDAAARASASDAAWASADAAARASASDAALASADADAAWASAYLALCAIVRKHYPLPPAIS